MNGETGLIFIYFLTENTKNPIPATEMGTINSTVEALNKERKPKLSATQLRNLDKEEREKSPDCVAAKSEAEYCFQTVGARNQTSFLKRDEKEGASNWEISKRKDSIAFYDKKAQEVSLKYQKAKGKAISSDVCDFVSFRLGGETISEKSKKRLLDQTQSACGNKNLGFEFN